MKYFVALALALSLLFGGPLSAQTLPAAGIRTINHTDSRVSIAIGGWTKDRVVSGWLAPQSHHDWAFTGNTIDANIGNQKVSIKLKSACTAPKAYFVELVQTSAGFAWKELGCELP